MDQKKIILAVVLCIGILFIWQKLFPPPMPPPAKHPAATETASKAATDQAAAKSAANPSAAPAAGDGPSAAGAAAGGALPSFPPRETVIETADERFVFTNQGAALKSARLRAAKYLQTPGDPLSGVEVLKSADPRNAAFRVDFDTKSFATPPDSSWRLVEGTPQGEVVYRAELPTVAIEKRFVVDKTRYRIHLDVTVENRSPAPQDHHLQIHVAAHQDPSAKGGFLSGAASNTSSLMCHDAEKVHREHIEGLEKSPLKQAGGIRWLGADEKFFLVAVVPYPETPPRDRACDGKAAGDGWGEGTLSFAERQVAPRAAHDLFVRDLRRSQSHRRSRGGAPGRRGRGPRERGGC